MLKQTAEDDITKINQVKEECEQIAMFFQLLPADQTEMLNFCFTMMSCRQNETMFVEFAQFNIILHVSDGGYVHFVETETTIVTGRDILVFVVVLGLLHTTHHCVDGQNSRVNGKRDGNNDQRRQMTLGIYEMYFVSWRLL